MSDIINNEEKEELKESDTEILKPKKERKPRSENQKEQFKKAAIKRTENIAKSKEDKRVEAAKLLLSKGIKIPKQEPETESESESEEEIVVVKKKREIKPKPKDKRKKRVVIEYSDSSDSDSSVPPSPPPTPPQKERKLVSQQNKKSLIKVNLPVPKIVNYFAD